MKPTLRARFCGLGLGLAFILAASLAAAQEYSHARIVRLSFVEGTVTVQRPEVTDWAKAFVNTPLQEGFQVATAEDAFAEVEFENASTARLGKQTLLEFAQLVLKPSGGKVNRLRLHQGYATFSFTPENDDFYEVMAGEATLTPRGKARFRLDMEEGLLVVKVFKGAVEVVSPQGNGTIGENAMLELRYGAEQVFQIAQGFTRDAWDEWVEQREGQTELVLHRGWSPTAYSNDVTDLLYGWTDLGLYGDWVSVPGYGYGWMPSGVGMGWRPFFNGRWGWYPGLGYTWVSFEPWGWLPYHYGYWVYDFALGWCWIPSGLRAWSPAVVNWYQGPGWVGWSPRGGLGGQDPCVRTRGCGTTVSEDTVRDGQPITADRVLDYNPRAGRPVERPDISPSGRGQLPGAPFTPSAAGARGGGARQPGRVPTADEVSSSTPEAAATGATRSAGAPVGTPSGRVSPGPRAPAKGGIVFDPEERGYVNDPAGEPEVHDVRELPGVGERGARSAPAPAAAPLGGSREAGAGVARAGRPGPQGGVAAPSAERGQRGGDAFREAGESRTWSEPGFEGRRSGAAPRGDHHSRSHEGWGRESRSSDRPSSSERSTPSPRSHDSGGSVSRSSSSSDHGSSGGSSHGGGTSGGGGGGSSGGSSQGGGTSGGGGGGSAPSSPPSGGRPPR